MDELYENYFPKLFIAACNYDTSDVKFLVSEQPDHGPGHIRSAEELHSGMIVQAVGRAGVRELLVVHMGKKIEYDKDSFRNKLVRDPNWMVVNGRNYDGAPVLESMPLADHGVVSYGGESNLWNKVNHLRHPEPAPTPEA